MSKEGWKENVDNVNVGSTILLQFLLVFLAPVCLPSASAGDFHPGPLFDHYELTLEPGNKTEIAGPFYYREEREFEQIWAVPPFLSCARDTATSTLEFDFLYPVATYDRYGDQYRWQFFQLLSYSGGETQVESDRDRFTIFPFYFQQRSSIPDQNYTALLPFYGRLKNRLFRDEVFFVMMPFYVQSRKRDVITDNYLYPVFHLRHGTGLYGWQFWPLGGYEQKRVTMRTNNFDETEIIGGYKKSFILWPFFAQQTLGIGTTNQSTQNQLLPAYSLYRSPSRDQTTVIWPFFSWIDEREKKYQEWEGPWPFIVFARGEGKTTKRVWPLYSHAYNSVLESRSYMWPIYRSTRIRSAPLDRRRTRVLFFVYSDTLSANTETGASKRRVDFWPFFTHERDFNGNTRLQALAPLEPYLPGAHKIARDYSPLWSVWRAEKNPKTGVSSQSLFWNLYRRRVEGDEKQCSAFFGLYQYESRSEEKRVRWFYLPAMTRKSGATTTAKQ